MSLDRTEELLAANRALRESEERFRSLVELSSDFYWETDIGHRYTAIELGWAYTGVRNNQSKIGLARWEIAHASPDEAAWETHRAAIAARERFVGFRFSRIEEGEERFYEHSGEPRYDPQGNFLGYRGVGRDVTARKRAEEALRASEERYSLAVEASEEGHFDVKYDTKERFYSGRLYELFGIAPGTRFADRAEALKQMRFYGNDAEIYASGIRAVEARNGPERYEFEFRIVLPSGEMRWLRTRGKVARDAEGNIRRRTGIAADITKAKLAEQELRESQERYALAVAGSNDGVWDVDFAARRVFSSARARELAGMPPGREVVPMEEWFASLPLHPDDAARRAEAFQAHLAGATPAYVGEFRLLQPDGAYRWRLLRGLCVRAADGKPQRMAGSISDIDARRRAEDALRLSEERYALAMEASAEGHFDWNVQTDGIFASAHLRKMLDLPADVEYRARGDMVSRMRFYPGDGEGVAEMAREVLAGSALQHEFEYRLLRGAARELRWIRARWKIFRDAHGVAQRVIGVVADITERKLAADELRESEARFRSLTELSSDWYWRQDESLRFTYSTAAIHPPEGYPGGSAIGKTRRELPGIVPLSSSWAEHQGLLAARKPFRDFEYSRPAGDGTLRYISTSGAPIFDEQGRFKGYQGIGRSITERKRIEEELRSRQEMLELAQKSAQVVAFEWRIGADGGNRNPWSPEIAAMYGVAPEAYDGSFEQWKSFIHREDWPAVRQAIKHAQRDGDVDAEYRVLQPDRSVHWLHAKGRMFFDADGKPERMVGFMHDVTERKRVEEELRRMERLAQRLEAMGTLAGGIAHDFNNILGAILGFTEMAWREAPKGSRLQRDLESIATAGERGRALVDRILAFSRSGVGERVAVHVEQVAREALDLLSAKLPPSVTLRAELRAGRAAMLGDPTQVHQVLMNLGTNAVQAMPSGGTLRVSLDAVRCEAARAATVGKVAAGDYVVLRVADTGTGIAPEIRDRIFDPFFTTKEVGTGTGLGLSLVHGIVTELGGAIDLESSPGKGAAFTVYLRRAGDALDSSQEEQTELPRGGGQRVLVVDDEEPLVRLATRTLEDLGYRPVGFTSSAAALAAFRADPGRFDALIADERMPGLSGTALIREVRGVRRAIPVLLMSGYVGGALASLAREAGADDVLKKPVLARDLATSLARVLQQ